MAAFEGKLNNATLSAETEIIVHFADNQFLNFESLEEAKGFLRFYRSSPMVKQNPGKLYVLRLGQWSEAPG